MGRRRAPVEDLKTGPAEPRSTVMTEAEEAMVVAVRRHTLLPLDGCLWALQSSMPHLTRSALHRCLQRHGISRLADVKGDKPKWQQCKRCPIGLVHIDIAAVQTAEGKRDVRGWTGCRACASIRTGSPDDPRQFTDTGFDRIRFTVSRSARLHSCGGRPLSSRAMSSSTMSPIRVKATSSAPARCADSRNPSSDRTG